MGSMFPYHVKNEQISYAGINRIEEFYRDIKEAVEVELGSRRTDGSSRSTKDIAAVGPDMSFPQDQLV